MIYIYIININICTFCWAICGFIAQKQHKHHTLLRGETKKQDLCLRKTAVRGAEVVPNPARDTTSLGWAYNTGTWSMKQVFM